MSLIAVTMRRELSTVDCCSALLARRAEEQERGQHPLHLDVAVEELFQLPPQRQVEGVLLGVVEDLVVAHRHTTHVESAVMRPATTQQIVAV
jgi:hypothetical protein